MKKSIILRVLCAAGLLLMTFSLHAQDESIVIEAESGTLGADYNTLEEDGVNYITSATDFAHGDYPAEAGKVASYEVTFPEAGTYDLYVRIRVGPDGADDDSFYYGNGFGTKTIDSADHWTRVNNVNSGGYTVETDVVQGAGGAQNNVWKWINLSEFEGDEDPVIFTVAEDSLTQTFQIGGRENGLDIDKIAFGKSDLYYTVSNLDNEEAGSEELPDEDPLPPPIAEGHSKFLGCIYGGSQSTDFEGYWNQVVAENASKWGHVEGTRNTFTWGQSDNIYDFAREQGFPYRWHVLVWGNQQPSWMLGLDSTEQRTELEQWFEAVADRYDSLGIDFVEVVNEPLHDPPTVQDGESGSGGYYETLGGSGETGWDWIIEAFKMARQYFHDTTTLMINDYNIINSTDNTNQYIEIIELLQADTLIDAIGVQAHAFSHGAPATIANNLDSLAATGLPLYVTEMDVDGPSDGIQLRNYQRIFPIFWEHPAVEGVTLWGFQPGLWRETANLITSQGVERPALTWLRAYVNGTYAPMSDISIAVSGGGAAEITEDDGTLQLIAEILPDTATLSSVEWSVNDTIASIDANGLLTAQANGTVTVTASSMEYQSDVEATLDVTISNQVITHVELTDRSHQDNFKIYPNPAMNGKFTIEGTENISRIRIMDINGIMVKDLHINDQSSIEVELETAPGLYVIQLDNGEQFLYQNVLVE